jgi:uncharacterized protein
LSVLSDRIRGIVSPDARSGSPARPGPLNPPGGLPDAPGLPGPSGLLSPPGLPCLAAALGGEWHDGCFVVHRRSEASDVHGRERVGAIAARFDAAAGDAPLFARGAPARSPFVFFDLETTGLSGGAGTHAFLVGCGWFDDGAFVTKQFVLTRYADERRLLETVSVELARAGALVSFNGKSFDAPVLETRYLFHRLEWAGGRLPHVDVLHPARQFWGRGRPVLDPREHHRASGSSAGVGHRAVDDRWALRGAGDCSLGALERHLLGLLRSGDVPGCEIPERYFQFVRTGDARPLSAVLEHNRIDLLSLAALASRLFHLAFAGPGDVRDAHEALALGRVYARAGMDARAREAFQCAVARSGRGAVRIASLRCLASELRRARRFEEAAVCWRAMMDEPGCPAALVLDATEALAIHHEHRVRDLATARTFALRSLEESERGARPGWTRAVRHRLARIDRKLEGAKSGAGRQKPLAFEAIDGRPPG